MSFLALLPALTGLGTFSFLVFSTLTSPLLRRLIFFVPDAATGELCTEK